MKPPKMVYEMVIDRNNFFANHVIPLSNSLSIAWKLKGDWMQNEKKYNT